MNNDSVLKKEFKKSDVERVRNLVKKDYTSSTKQQTGYRKSSKRYKEGDVWEENGKKWTIKNGIKQNITKLDKAKKAHVIPLLCPKCKKLMKRSDKPYYNIHKFCLNCYAKFEDKLKSEGKYKSHFSKINNKIIDQRIEDFKNFVVEQLNESNNSFISEDGVVEKWDGNLDSNKVDEYVSVVVEHLENLKVKED